MARGTRATGLSTRIIGLSLAVAVVPLAVFGVWTVRESKRVLADSVGASLVKDAQRVASDLEHTLAEKRRVLTALAQQDLVRSNVPDDLDGVITNLAAGQCREDPQIAVLHCVDARGKISASSSPRHVGARLDSTRAPWLVNALALTSGQTLSGEPDRESPEHVLLLATPVHSAYATASVASAVLVLELRRSAVKPTVAADLQETVFVVDEKDRVVAATGPGGAPAPGAEAVWPRVRSAVDREPSTLEGAWLGAASARPSGTMPWQVVVLAPSEVAFASSYALARTAVITGLLAAIVAVGVSLGVSRRIVRPLQDLTARAARIAEQGDLAQEFAAAADRGDEVGELAASFERMVRNLREVLGILRESTVSLTRAVDDLNASTTEQRQIVTRQAAALQETHSTAQEIKETSVLAAQKAESVLNVASRADEVGRSGEAALERSLAGLTDMRSTAEQLTSKIAPLGERTRQIGGITQTVKDLADQSNILALNAAIEAARSGEQGKGFAIVAREIRSLADQSSQATNRVRDILEDIAGAINQAVSIAEKGAERTEGGAVQVKASGESLRELSAIVREISAAARQIAAAVSQQNAGIAQIFTAVTQQLEMMEDAKTRIERTGNAAAALREIPSRVSSLLGRYRL